MLEASPNVSEVPRPTSLAWWSIYLFLRPWTRRCPRALWAHPGVQREPRLLRLPPQRFPSPGPGLYLEYPGKATRLMNRSHGGSGLVTAVFLRSAGTPRLCRGCWSSLSTPPPPALGRSPLAWSRSPCFRTTGPSLEDGRKRVIRRDIELRPF